MEYTLLLEIAQQQQMPDLFYCFGAVGKGGNVWGILLDVSIELLHQSGAI